MDVLHILQEGKSSSQILLQQMCVCSFLELLQRKYVLEMISRKMGNICCKKWHLCQIDYLEPIVWQKWPAHGHLSVAPNLLKFKWFPFKIAIQNYFLSLIHGSLNKLNIVCVQMFWALWGKFGAVWHLYVRVAAGEIPSNLGTRSLLCYLRSRSDHVSITQTTKKFNMAGARDSNLALGQMSESRWFWSILSCNEFWGKKTWNVCPL